MPVIRVYFFVNFIRIPPLFPHYFVSIVLYPVPFTSPLRWDG